MWMKRLTGAFAIVLVTSFAFAASPNISSRRAQTVTLRAAPGRILRTTLERSRGRRVYFVAIKTAEGIIAEVTVDARTGKVVDVQDLR